MKILTRSWDKSTETLVESEQSTLTRLLEAEALFPPYERGTRKIVHVALKELQCSLQAHVKDLLEAQAAHLDTGRKRKSQGPALMLGHAWTAAVREGLLLFPKHKAHALRVTLRGWERGLRIADDLFTMASLRGYEPVPWKKGDKALKIRAVGAELDFRIMEKLARVQDDGDGTATGRPYANYLLTTGLMSIHLERGGGGAEMMDREGTPLEDQLEELFDRIPHEFVLDLAQNRKWRRAEEAYAEAREAAAEQTRLKNEETARRKQLEVEAQDWHRANMIRQYAEEVERLVLPDAGAAAKEWLEWARMVADGMDPTSTRCNRLRQTAAETKSQSGTEGGSASDDTARGAIRKGVGSADFEALPRVWPLRQWTT
ncbi:Uncharacterised protein [Achromobacter xylosoxidans]|uniref:hypothetical protein n=1 Tax=Alcaligenes xylosoxydans xylosoxydans TaxID=85698 RepID=UPI0006C51A2F|nr:hypothetical protein [Achromobacter xylosoxidans]CUJ03806.1 Uncharacterised protein [Achromobacter xylosoxidans]